MTEAAPPMPPLPPTGAAASGLPSSPPARSPSRLRGRTIVVVLVVVAILVVSGLYLTGLPPFHTGSSSTGPPHGPVTFATARAAGDAAVHGYQGGSWQLYFAGGLVSRTALAYPVGSGATFRNCSIEPLAGVTQILAPPNPASESSGTSSLWGLLYWDGSSGLVVSVVNGTAAITATISAGTSCLAAFQFIAPIPTTIADSSTVAQAAAAAGGKAFLASHPGANLSFGVVPGVSAIIVSFPPTWRVAYSACPLGKATPGTAPEFNATLDAAGVVTYSHLGQTNCSGIPSSGSLPILGGLSFVHRLSNAAAFGSVVIAPRPRAPP